MLQFLPMLQKGVNGSQQTPSGGSQLDNFFKALGADKMGQPASAGKNTVGMQYANAGMQAPEQPNMMNMINQMSQGNQAQQRQQLPTGQINPLLQMLMNGGR